MQLSKEELLRPRFRLLIDYPGNQHPIGHVFSIEGDETLIEIWCKEREKYKYIFQKLEWWEERTDDEFPDFVKDYETGEVYRTSTRLKSEPRRLYVINKEHKTVWVIISDLIPATKEEFYKQYA